MIKIALMIFLLTLTLTLEINDKSQQKTFNVSSQNSLSPFNLNPSSDEEGEKIFTVQITCNNAVRENVIFQGDYTDLCDKRTYKGTINELNTFLNSISFKTKEDIQTSEILNIDFNIFEKEKNEKTAVQFSQKLVPLNELPVILVNTSLPVSGSYQTKSQVKVLEIDQSYFQNALDNKFSIKAQNKELPNWLKYKFERNALYLIGNPPVNLQSGFSFDITVIDEKTQLSSKPITITTNNVSIQKTYKTVVIVFVVVFTLACMAFVYLCYTHKTKKKKPVIKGTCNNESENLGNRRDLLSESIINWNSNLSKKMKKRNSDCTTMDEINVICEKNLEVAEWVEESEDDNEFNTITEFDKAGFSVDMDLSVIEENDYKQKTNRRTSVFMEEIPF